MRLYIVLLAPNQHFIRLGHIHLRLVMISHFARCGPRWLHFGGLHVELVNVVAVGIGGDFPRLGCGLGGCFTG